MSWLDRKVDLRGSLKFYFRFVPPFVLIALPIVAAYGAMSPWPAANEFLRNRGYESPVTVGFGSRSDCSRENEGPWSCNNEKYRQFISLKSFIARPAVTTVSQRNGGNVEASDSDPFTAIGAFITYVLCGLFTWFVWVNPRRKSD